MYQTYDLAAAMQFNLLTFLGLREHHFLLDLGCGSLRGGKLFIPYLLSGHYYGIEPEQWLIEEGIRNELGEDIIGIKQPVFSNDKNFTSTIFNRKFDFILAHSIFTHASVGQIRRCLIEAREAMLPTSIFAATFLQGEADYAGNEWVYPNCVTYTFQRMSSLVGEQGLICKSFDWTHPSGHTWILIMNPENERNIPALSDILRLSYLEDKLERLSRIEAHPYVRLGLQIHRLARRINSRAKRRIKRWITR